MREPGRLPVAAAGRLAAMQVGWLPPQQAARRRNPSRARLPLHSQLLYKSCHLRLPDRALVIHYNGARTSCRHWTQCAHATRLTTSRMNASTFHGRVVAAALGTSCAPPFLAAVARRAAYFKSCFGDPLPQVTQRRDRPP